MVVKAIREAVREAVRKALWIKGSLVFLDSKSFPELEKSRNEAFAFTDLLRKGTLKAKRFNDPRLELQRLAFKSAITLLAITERARRGR